MKRKSKSGMPNPVFEQLDLGEVFSFVSLYRPGECFMKVDENENDNGRAVNLDTGELLYVENNTAVRKYPNASYDLGDS